MTGFPQVRLMIQADGNTTKADTIEGLQSTLPEVTHSDLADSRGHPLHIPRKEAGIRWHLNGF